MFEKISRMAETAANNVSVSRRGFLGRLGQSALGVAGILAGLTATTASAQKGGSYVCCIWKCVRGTFPKTYKSCYPAGFNCAFSFNPCYFGLGTFSQKSVNSCKVC